MLTVALLALFTLLCVLLSADRAWDNVTKPERNALVFDGRNRSYGAFVLRREYDRRFVWAFAGAMAMVGAAVIVPKALGSLGVWTVPTSLPVPPIIQDWVLTDPIEPRKAPEEPKSAPEKHAASVLPSKPDEGRIVVVDKDSAITKTPLTSDTLEHGPVDPGPGTGGKEPLPPGGTTGGLPGTELGNSTKIWELPEVEVYPEFVGGQGAMMRFIQDHIRFPESDDSKYKAFIEFVVDGDGSVISVRIKRKGREAFDEAAARVVRAMPKWNPARLKSGQEVPCLLVLPIEFRTQ
jgi:protein TonB